MKKLLRFATLFFVAASVCLTTSSCSDDKDEPFGEDDRINSIGDIPGLWLSTVNSDYIVVTLTDKPIDFCGNRLAYYKGGVVENYGVPRIYQEQNSPNYIVNGGTDKQFEIVAFNRNKGYMKIVDMGITNEFIRQYGGVACISNKTTKSYTSARISVYEAGTQKLIYQAQIPGISSFNGKSVPFYTGPVASDIVAECYNSYSDTSDTFTWTDVDPTKYTTLSI